MATAAEIDILIRARDEATAQLEGIGKALGGLGKALLAVTEAAAATAVAVAGVSMKMAAGFETMTNNIRNNTTMTNADFGTMTAAIQKLAVEGGTSFEELGKGFMHATNLGFSAADSVQILEAAMKSAVSTGGDVGQTTNALAMVMKEFAFAGNDAAKAMDVLHMTAAQGNMTLEDLVTSSGRAMSTAANFGASLNDVSAALSAMTRHGFDASEASTQLTGILTHINSPSKQAEDAIKALSKSSGVDLVRDFGAGAVRARGLANILDDLTKATHGHTEEVTKLIPALRGGQGAMALVGVGAQDFHEVLGKLNDVMAGNLMPTEEAWARTTATTGFQMAQLKMRLEEAAVALGSVLLPFANRFLTWLQTVLPSTEQVQAAIQDFGGWMGGLGQTVDDLMKGPLGGFSDFLFSTLPLAVSEANVVLRNLGTTVREVFSALMGGDIGGAFRTLGTALAPLGDAFLGLGARLTGWIGDQVRLIDWAGVWANTKATAFDLSVAFGDLVAKVEGWLGDAVAAVDWSTIWRRTKATALDLSSAFVDVATQLGTWIAAQAKTIGQHLSTWTLQFIAWVGPMIPQVLASLGMLLDRMGAWIAQQVPVLLGKLAAWGKALWGWVVAVTPPLLVELGTLLARLWAWITTQTSMITTKLAEWGRAFWGWVVMVTPSLLAELGNLLLRLWNWISTQTGAIAAKLAEWGIAFWAWLGQVTPPLLAALSNLLLRLWNWISDQVGPLGIKLEEWAIAFWGWITPMVPRLLTALADLGRQLWTWIETQTPLLLGKLAEWGKQFWNWVVPATTELLGRLPALIERLSTWVTMQAPILADKLLTWIAEFFNWLVPVMEKFGDKAAPMLEAITKWITYAAGVLAIALVAWSAKFWLWITNDVIPVLPDKLGAMLPVIGMWIINVGAPALAKLSLSLGGAILSGMVKGLSDLGETAAKALDDAGHTTAASYVRAIADWITSNAKQIILDAMLRALPLNIGELLKQVLGSATAAPAAAPAASAGGVNKDILAYGAEVARILGPAAGRFAVAQARLETGNGRNMSTAYNYGNVGNTDSNPTGGPGYASPQAAAADIVAIWQKERPELIAAFKDNTASVESLTTIIQKPGYAWATDPNYVSKVAAMDPGNVFSSGKGLDPQMGQQDWFRDMGTTFWTACGEAAAGDLIRAYGGNPSPQQLIDIAKSPAVGWHPGEGTSLEGVQAIIKQAGDIVTRQGTLEEAKQATPQNPVIMLTLGQGKGHYFEVTGYDEATGQYNVGGTGTALKGGKPQMTMADMQALGFAGFGGSTIMRADQPKTGSGVLGEMGGFTPDTANAMAAGAEVMAKMASAKYWDALKAGNSKESMAWLQISQVTGAEGGKAFGLGVSGPGQAATLLAAQNYWAALQSGDKDAATMWLNISQQLGETGAANVGNGFTKAVATVTPQVMAEVGRLLSSGATAIQTILDKTADPAAHASLIQRYTEWQQQLAAVATGQQKTTDVFTRTNPVFEWAAKTLGGAAQQAWDLAAGTTATGTAAAGTATPVTGASGNIDHLRDMSLQAATGLAAVREHFQKLPGDIANANQPVRDMTGLFRGLAEQAERLRLAMGGGGGGGASSSAGGFTGAGTIGAGAASFGTGTASPMSVSTTGVMHLQHGGIVWRPTLAIVGEAGPERVTPLRGGGNDAGITININAPVYGVAHLQDVIVQALDVAKRRGRA